MNFRNRNHQAIFMAVTTKFDRRDKAKMSVLYLLTADIRLWKASKPHIVRGQIHLERIRMANGSERTYALLCCAKDLAYGTNHLTVADLADIELVSSKLYGLIMTAIGIYRYGLENKIKNRENKHVKTNAQ